MSAEEFRTLEEIHAGHDEQAVKILRGAREIMKHFVAHFTAAKLNDVSALSAAQTIRELADRLASIGAKSGNELAAQDLEHERKRLTHFLMTTGIDPDSEGKFRFRM